MSLTLGLGELSPVTSPANPFLPWNPPRVARMTGRWGCLCWAHHMALMIPSEPVAAHITLLSLGELR